MALVTAAWRDRTHSFYRERGWSEYGVWFVKPLADDVHPSGQPVDDD
jgi:hypothetical protein